MLFNLLPMYILHDIYIWIIKLEYINKLKDVMTRIKVHKIQYYTCIPIWTGKSIYTLGTSWSSSRLDMNGRTYITYRSYAVYKKYALDQTWTWKYELSPAAKNCTRVLWISHIIYLQHILHILMSTYTMGILSYHHKNILFYTCIPR